MTKIEWTQSDDGTPGKTWNPTTGCDRVSPGCDNCYALAMARRLKGMGHAKYQTDGRPETSGPGFGVQTHPDTLDQPLRWRKPRRVFVDSMSDLFHPQVPDDFIARVWQVMAVTPQHTYQVLTKRPKRMYSWVTRWYAEEIAEPFAVSDVPRAAGYRVTTHGEVIGPRGTLSPDVGEQGHQRVTIYGGKQRRDLVHRLVLTTFVRPARQGEQACHRNGDPSDNRLSNLYWGTQEDNWADRHRHGNARSWSRLTDEQVDEIRTRAARGESAYGMAPDYGVSDTQIRNILSGRQWSAPTGAEVPRRPTLPQCWLGTSVEDQARADRRIPPLLETPAAVRFLSCEPLLGPVDLSYTLDPEGFERDTWLNYLDWVIVGGESGPGARSMHLGWARSIVEQCQAAGVAPFVKQLGSRPAAWPVTGKGGDPDEWPPELRVREFPEAVPV